MQGFPTNQIINKSSQQGPLQQIWTLDERWLEFIARTNHIFAAIPELIPLRQTIFRGYVERKPQQSYTYWLRPLLKSMLQHQASKGNLATRHHFKTRKKDRR